MIFFEYFAEHIDLPYKRIFTLMSLTDTFYTTFRKYYKHTFTCMQSFGLSFGVFFFLFLKFISNTPVFLMMDEDGRAFA